MPKAAPATARPSRAKAPVLPDDVSAPLDRAIADLEGGALAWSHLTLGQRARLLGRLRDSVVAVAEEWADVAATSKGLEPGHPLRGEEWLSGPYATLVALDAYRSTLEALAKGESPLRGIRTDAAPGGRLRAHVFPLSPIDGVLLSGYTGEIWFEPGVTEAQARRSAGLARLDDVDRRAEPLADPGAVLTSGSGAGAISFAQTSLKKITFEITSSNGTPKVAEFETYAS